MGPFSLYNMADLTQDLQVVPNKNNGYKIREFINRSYSQSTRGPKTVITLLGAVGLSFQCYDRTQKALPTLNTDQGVYILYHYNIKSRILEVYIGKSSDVARRQSEHAKSQTKDSLTKAILIVLPKNGFSGTDTSNLENGLYLNFKRRSNVILHNSNIPSADSSYCDEDYTNLETIDEITSVVLNKIFGEAAVSYGIKSHITSEHKDSKYIYDLVQWGKSTVSLERHPNRKMMMIQRGSIYAIAEKMDGTRKQALTEFIGKNKFIKLQEDVSTETEKIYLFEEDKKINNVEFKLLFGKLLPEYWMNADGELNKLTLTN